MYMPPRKKKAPKKAPKRKLARGTIPTQKQRQSVVVNINSQRKRVGTTMPKQQNPLFIPQQQDTGRIINAILSLDKRQPEIIRDVARVDVGERLLNPLVERREAQRVEPELSRQAFYATVAEERIARERAKRNFEDLPRSIPERSVSAPESYPRAEEPAPTRTVKEIVKEYNARFPYRDKRRIPISNKTDNKLLDDITARGLSLEQLAYPLAPTEPEVRQAEAQPERVLIGGGGIRGSIYEPFNPQQTFTSNEPPKRTIIETVNPSLYETEQALIRQKIKEQQQGKDTTDIDAELLKISNAKLKPRQFRTQLSFESGEPVIQEEVPVERLQRKLKIKQPEPFAGFEEGFETEDV